jgi:hypothetical protein
MLLFLLTTACRSKRLAEEVVRWPLPAGPVGGLCCSDPGPVLVEKVLGPDGAWGGGMRDVDGPGGTGGRSEPLPGRVGGFAEAGPEGGAIYPMRSGCTAALLAGGAGCCEAVAVDVAPAAPWFS